MSNINWALLGKDVYDNRDALGLGTREYAGKIGLSFSTLNRIENGKKCEADIFVHVAVFLGFTPNRYVVKK